MWLDRLLQDLGFSPDGVLAARIPFPKKRYDTAEQKRVFFNAVLQRLNALPGVTKAAEASSVPPSGGLRSAVTIPGDVRPEKLRAGLQLCSEGFFQAVGTRLLRGRLLTESEVDSARHLVVVNQTLATQFFGGIDNAIGRSMKFDVFDRTPDAPHDAYYEVIGVIADVRNDGLGSPPVAQAFLPFTVTGVLGRMLIVRTAVKPMSLLPSIKNEIRAVDPGIAVTLAAPLSKMVEENAYAQPRFEAMILGLFAEVGLLLAAIGIFSLMTYVVSVQTREIGIRLALGARRSAIVLMVLRQGLAMIAIGVLVGEMVSVVATRLLRNQLFGVSAHDPVVLLAGVGVLVIVGTLACIVPARRATLVEPTVALRYE